MERREFNRLAAALLTGGLGGLDLDRIAAALIRSARPDEELAEQLRLLTHRLVEQTYVTTPDVVLPALRGHLDACLELTKSTSRPELRSIAGQVAQATGWCNYLLGRHTEAHALYALASSLANEAADKVLQAHTLAAVSKLHSQLTNGERQQSTMARAYLDEAARLSGADLSVNLRSWIYECQAEEHAAAGDGGASQMALEAAEKAIASAPATEDHWTRATAHCQEVWLDGYRGTCLLLLGRCSAAIPFLKKSLAATQPVADRCAVVADLATAWARVGDVERACDLLIDGLTMASQAGLALRVHRLLQVRKYELSEDSPAVLALDERIQPLIGA